ncbi:protein of unknown function (DUF1994) [Idiomarina sp. A28L]|uniref:HNH endonuclease family protein n=1 Tax=Idiomarina sp. A28L TaxID=1036674 RepID=UPI0002138A67|nr:HNH endonuclease family protein [Idiomarina sp. A28L]EGN76128.1 protein of unknown function (DUF1994) [Idiomarina sp. A28L]
MYRILFIIIATSLLLASSNTYADYIKQSNSGICHDPYSAYYERTKNYTRYASLEACIQNGGRLPAGHNAQTESQDSDKDYDRSRFRHWIDDNRNCLNTRHELLKSQSTGPIVKDESGCRVIHGRWNDPYTGEIFLESHHVDVDHLVPLQWAWFNGANTWNDDKRERFANDSRNLFIVSASANRSKGAKGPDEWLPPNEAFHCQYVTRYLRILILYDFAEEIRQTIRSIQNNICR